MVRDEIAPNYLHANCFELRVRSTGEAAHAIAASHELLADVAAEKAAAAGDEGVHGGGVSK